MFTDANLDRSEEGANLRDEDAAKQVQLHVTEAVFPALSEPGLYVCLNRGNVDFKAQQRSTKAAGRSLVSTVVDHIFLCIKDAGLAVAPRRKMGDADAEGPLSTSPNQLDGDKVTGATNHKSVNLEGSLLVQHE
ncbi:hypothetical protein GYH30_000762 [Glycine max]|nr:hypothetical protein GYH30_000762 [Glycine max]